MLPYVLPVPLIWYLILFISNGSQLHDFVLAIVIYKMYLRETGYENARLSTVSKQH